MSAGSRPVPVFVSAHTPVDLRVAADRLRAYLSTADADSRSSHDDSVIDIGFSSAIAAEQPEYRAAVVARDRDQLLAGLAGLAADDLGDGVVAGRVRTGSAPVFVFPGQGAQWRGMAVELLESAPVFARELAACDEALAEFVDWRLAEVLRGAAAAPSLDRVDVVQPALWSVMVSLAALWRSYGVQPSAVVGHSQGEIAAAVVAGGLSRSDGARVVALRSRAIAQRLAGLGGMVSIVAPVERVERVLSGCAGVMSVAAVNSPTSVVVSGEPAGLDELLRVCEREQIRARRIAVDYASHSAPVEIIRDELGELLAAVAPRTGSIPFYSTSVGGFIDTVRLDADYWYRSLRDRVGFEPAVRALIDHGAGCFVEISPHPVLTVPIEQSATAHGAREQVGVVGSLRRNEGGMQRFVFSMAKAHVFGVAVDWDGFYAGADARIVALPTAAVAP
ncbi:acyltransferase domain-containing protein [Nocardia sp. NPDC127579]|uniref:acyltransferase domain-containing protein n=1 Tax=Nocardia sp. NPDC127579 TaxID=3345402 RepID=UPI00363F26B6